MATIVTRSGKGSPLTNNEVDANFTNLNTDKLEVGGGTLTGALTISSGGLTVNSGTVNLNTTFQSTDDIVQIDFTDNDTTNSITSSGVGFRFLSGGTENVRLQNNGSFLIGKTSTGVADIGIEARKVGLLAVNRNNSTPVYFGRKTTDGAIIEFRKDTDQFGSIGVMNTDNLYISGDNANHSGLQFGTHSINPLEAGSTADGTIDIGLSTHRFKDLHLSGSISSGVINTTKQISADEIQYPLIVAGTDVGNTVNQTTASGIGVQFKLAGNSSSGDSLIGASIAAMRESDSDADSSTGLAFLVSQNDTTLDEALRIDHDANIGIGTNNPDAKLRIDQDANATALKVTGGGSGVMIAQFVRDVGADASVNINASAGEPQIQFVDANTFSMGVNSNFFEIADNDHIGTNTRFVIDNSGNVGINTSSPSSTLDVNGIVRTDLIQTRVTNLSTMSFLNFNMDTGASDGINNVVLASVNNLDFLIDTNANTSTSAFVFGTDGNTMQSGSELMRLNESGNLGLGIDSPLTRLHIKEDTEVAFNMESTTARLKFNNNNFISTSVASTTLGVNGSEKVRIQSTGEVGIGTTSPDTKVDLTSSGVHGLILNEDLANESASSRLFLKSSQRINTILNLSGNLEFRTGATIGNSSGTVRMLIDGSNGNVAIGSTSPNYSLDVDTVGHNSTGELLITGGNSASNDYTQTSLLKLRATSINPNQPNHNEHSSVAEIRLNHQDLAGNASSGSITFFTNPSNNINSSLTQRMVLDSSGNLLVGKTNNTLSNDGTVIRSGGEILVTNTSDYSGNFNRSGTDGAIVGFYKDGSTVGSIGVANSNNLTIVGTVADHGGLQFGTHSITPMEAGVDSQGTIDLGTANAKFKDLHLSGFAFVGTQLAPVNGTASVPAYGFSADSDTGMFRATTNELAFATGGTERARFDSSGSFIVGGTTAQGVSAVTLTQGGSIITDGFVRPFTNAAYDLGDSSKKWKDLYLNGVANAAGFQSNQTTTGFGYINFGDTDDSNIGQIGYDHTDNYMRFQVNNTEKVRIDSSGRLGLGTTSPKQKLHIDGGTTSTGGILIDNVNYASSQDSPQIIFGTSGWTGATTNWNTYGFQIRLKSTDTGVPRLSFDVSSGEAFSIDNNKTVNFTSSLTGTSITTSGNIRAGSSTGNNVLLNNTGSIEITRANGAFVDFKTDNSEDYDGRIIMDTSNNMTFHTRTGSAASAPAKFIIQNDGNVKVINSNFYVNTGSLYVGTGDVNESIKLGHYNSSESQITGLVSGSTFGSLITGATNGHIVVALRDNDVGDSFNIISGSGNYMADSTFDKKVFSVRADGAATFSDTISCGAITSTGNNTFKSITGSGQAVDLEFLSTNTSGFGNSYVINSRIRSVTASSSNAFNSKLEFYTSDTSDNVNLGLSISEAQNVNIPNGSLMVGATTAPSSYYAFANNLVVTGDSANRAGITISGTATSMINLSDGTDLVGFIDYNHSNDSMTLGTAESNALVIDSSQNATFSGNVGIGDALSAWGDTSKVLQIGSLALEDYPVSGANVSVFYNNAFRNNSNNIVYKETDFASIYSQFNGEHKFSVAPSGSANATISFTEALKISSSANVNIPNGGLMVGATTAPSSKLELTDPSTNGIAQIAFSNDAREYRFGVHGGVSDSLVLFDATASSTRLTLDTSGKVIIGDGASHTDDLFQIETPASGGGHGIQIRRNDANGDQQIGRILFGNNTDTDLAQIAAKTDGDGNSGDSGALLFSTQPTGGSLAERMRIDSSGTLIIKSGNKLQANRADNSRNVQLFCDNNFGTIETSTDPIKIASQVYTRFDTSSTERMRLTSTGLGIGTSSPTHTLQVHTASTGAFINRTTASNAANLAEFSANRAFTIFNRASGSYLVFGGNSARTDIQATDLATSPTAKNIHLNPHGGNIGIGTGQTAPARGLQIHKEGNHLSLTTTASGTAAGNGSDFKVDATSSDLQILNYESANTTLWTSGSERMRLNASGDWMVSNTVANVASHYDNQGGCGWIDSDHHFEIATTTNRSALEVSRNNGNQGGIITFRQQATVIGDIGSSASSSLTLNARNTGNLIFQSGTVEKMRLNSSGNLGISTNVPDTKLTIYHANQSMTPTIKLWASTADNTGTVGSAIDFVGSSDKTAVGARISATRVAGGAFMDLRFHTGRNTDSDHEKMRIDKDGNVGIGTTSPNYLLDVEGTGALFRVHSTSGESVLQLQVSDTTSINDINFGDTGATARGQIRYRHNGDSLAISTAGTERMRLSATGDLGINTTAPDSKLHIAEDAFDQTIVKLNFSSADSSAGNYAHFGEIRLAGHSTNCQTAIRSYSNAFQNSNGALAFWTQEHGGSFDERMRILGDGKIGIGTAVPDATLRIDNESGVAFKVTGGALGTSIASFVRDVGANATINIHADSARPQISLASSQNTFSMGVTGSSFEIADSSALGSNTRLTIDSSGRVGLGTTSPSFPFDLHHLTPEINLKDLSSTAQFRITLDGVDTSIQNKGSAGHVIFTTQNGSGQEFERMRLEPSGEIHITSGGPAIEPTIKHANATEGSSAKLRVINRSGQAGDKGGILELGGVTDDGVSRADVFASIAGLKTNSTSANRQGFMQFLTSNGVSLTERMRLTAFGKLGLGTTNPSNILDCTGSISNDYVAAFENTDSTNGYGLLAKTAHTGTSAFAFGAYGGSNALMVVRGDGQVAIGTVNPNSYTNQRVLTINGTTHSRIDFETGSTLRASVYGDSGSLNIDALGNFTRFYTGNSEKMRLDSLGNLLVGTTSSYGDKLNINGTGHFTSNLTLSRQTNDSGSTGLILEKTRNTSVDGNTVVQAGDQLGYIAFRGNDGDQFLDGAFILSFVDGTPSNNDMPTNLQFWTTSDGASSPSERMRIDSSGNVGVGVSSPQTRFHVQSSDGSGIRVSRSGATAHMQLFPAYSNVPTIMGLGAGGLHLGYNSNTDGIRIGTNNNVGIGETSPLSPLVIKRTENTVFDATSTNGQDQNGATLAIQNLSDTNNTFSQLLLRNRNSSKAVSRIVSLTNGTGTDLAFVVENQASSPSEAIRINKQGALLIGKTADNDTDVGVRIQSNGATSINRSGGLSANVINTSSGFGLNVTAGGTATSGNWAFRIEDGGGNAFHHFFSDAIGIGTSSPTSFINTGNFFKPSSSGTAKFLTIDGGTSAANIMLQGNITGENPLGGIYWTSTNGQATGNRQVAAIDVQIDDHSDATFDGGSLRFFTKPAGGGVQSPRMTLLANGNLIFGKTADNDTSAGIRFQSNGSASFVRDSNVALHVQRLTSLGNIMEFRKDNSIVGKLGIESSGFYIDGEVSHCGLKFKSGALTPRFNGSDSDNTLNLGESGVRFKDLFLSGKSLSGYSVATGALAAYESGAGIYTFTTGGVGFLSAHSSGSTFGELKLRGSFTSFCVGSTEKARLDTSGNLLVGTTAVADTDNAVSLRNDGRATFASNVSSTTIEVIRHSSGTAMEFVNTGGSPIVGSISVTGTATAYNTSSDARLKENIEDADDSGTAIDSLQVRQFDWKSNGKHEDYGMIAQEVIHTCPNAVSVPQEDGEMMGIDYSKMVPLLLKEIQELRKRVKKLEE